MLAQSHSTQCNLGSQGRVLPYSVALGLRSTAGHQRGEVLLRTVHLLTRRTNTGSPKSGIGKHKGIISVPGNSNAIMLTSIQYRTCYMCDCAAHKAPVAARAPVPHIVR